MIGVINQADCLVLVVSSAQGEFESSVAGKGHMRDQLLIAHAFGVKRVIVVVNKLDLLPPNLTELRFKEVIFEVKSILMAIGFDLHSVIFLPLSGLTADNLHKKSDKLVWFNGPSLVQAIDLLPVPQRPFDLPLRMPIHACFKISGVGTVALGRIETGKMKPGMKVAFCPGVLVSECRTIEMH